MSVRTMAALAGPCWSAKPPAAAAEAVTTKSRRDGLAESTAASSVSLLSGIVMFDPPATTSSGEACGVWERHQPDAGCPRHDGFIGHHLALAAAECTGERDP